MSSNNVIWISNSGKRLYSRYEYLLDIIETNLNCYSDDFFSNDDNFGTFGVNLSNLEAVKKLVEDIIKNRIPNETISVSDINTDGNSIVITLTGQSSEEQIKLESNQKLISILRIKDNN